ncbi:hypothetical protein ACTFIW_012424 [Dictyostelium discoideum]
MISNSTHIKTLDKNYDILKKEFKQLSDSSTSIEISLKSYCSYIKELYLSPDSICNNLKRYYDLEHPLSQYSKDVLDLVQNGYTDWELNQAENFKVISSFCLDIKDCNNKIKVIDDLQSLLLASADSNKKNEYIDLKSKLFTNVKQCFDRKVSDLDIPLINIQLSFNSLFHLFDQILSNSSILLQNQIKYISPVSDLLPNNDFINNNNSSNQQKPTSPTAAATTSPTIPFSKRPPSQGFKLPPLQQQQQQQQPTNNLNSSQQLRPAPLPQSNSTTAPTTSNTALRPAPLPQLNSTTTTNTPPVVPFSKRPPSQTFKLLPQPIQQQQPQQEQPQKPATFPFKLKPVAVNPTSTASATTSTPTPTTVPLSKRPASQTFKLPPQPQTQPQTSQPIPAQPIPTTLKQTVNAQPPPRPINPNALSKPTQPIQPATSVSKLNAFSPFKRTDENIYKSNNALPTTAPPLGKLINDHQIHKLLWDKKFKLVKTYNYSVTAEYKVVIKYKPECTLSNVKVWMPKPESINNQIIRSATMKLYDGDSNIELIEPEITDSSHQKIWYFNYLSPIENPYKTHYVFKEILEVDLYKVELVEVKDPNQVVEVEPITDNEIEIYLRPTHQLDFNTPEFAEFVEENGFYPKTFDDGTMESVLCFAYRILLWMTENLDYKYPHGLSGKPIETFKAKHGDCGCHSNFFASIMRYSNVPTRLLFGRNADLDKPGDGQTHVKPEIYISSIGWVPIEVTGKSKNGYCDYFFGKDQGNFITYGMDFISDIKDLSNAFTVFQLVCFGNYYKTGPYPDRLLFTHEYDVKLLKKSPSLSSTTPTQTQTQTPKPIQQPIRPVMKQQIQPQPQQSQTQPQPQQSQKQQSNPFGGFAKSLSKIIQNPQTTSSSTQSSSSAPYDFKSNLAIPRNPHVDQLINDFALHKKIWGNKRFKLSKIYNNSVTAVYQSVMTFSNTKLSWTKQYLSVPPSINNQQVRYSSFTLHNGSNDELLVDSEIIGSSHNDIYRVSHKFESVHNIKSTIAKYRVDVDLYKVHLTEVKDPNEIIEVEPITDKEIEVYLRPTTKINFNAPEFQQFIEANRLYPYNGSGDIEGILEFAYRVSLFIYKNLKYQNPYSHDGTPTEAFKFGHGDCGVHSWFFSSILRYNNIPVRLLYGRGSKIATKDTQPHIKCEFYHQSIGWIPYDGAYKDGNPYHSGRFGIDNGDHVTFGLDFISDIEELCSPSTPFATFQNTYYLYSGSKLDSNSQLYDVYPLQN